MESALRKPPRFPANACVGWPGPCPDHGEHHGCMFSDGHESKHECSCGDTHPTVPLSVWNGRRAG